MTIQYTIPPITDELPIAVRAYATPSWREHSAADTEAPKSGKIYKEPAPASQWTLIFDTETSTDAAQSLRFGTYQLRKAGELRENGIFFESEGVDEGELAVLRCYADEHKLTLRTRDEFVAKVFVAVAWRYRATIVGFNLPFDISRLAIDHSTARTRAKASTDAMRRGFSFKLSDNDFHPHGSCPPAWCS